MANPPGVTSHIVPDDHRKVNLGDATHEFKDIRATTVTADTVTGAVVGNITGNVTGNVTGFATLAPSTITPATGAVTAADSGKLLVGAVDAAWELPAIAAVPSGTWFTFLTGTASAGAGVTIVATAAVIQGKTTPDGTTAITNATTLTNTPGTDVVGDWVTLRSDGTNWRMVGLSGIYAGT